MFCPKCGKELPDNSMICPDCGDISASANVPPSADVSSSSSDISPVKKKSNKPALIAGIAVLGAAVVAVPTILILGNTSGRKQLESHPTGYVMSSMGTYLSQMEKNSPVYSILHNPNKKGSVKITQTFDTASGKSETVRTIGYDESTNKFYIETNEQFNNPSYSLLYLLSGSVPSYFDYDSMFNTNLDPKNHIRFYTDIDTFNVDYSLSDNKGSYYLDSSNIRSDYEASVFANKDSAYYTESFQSVVDVYEKVYNLFKQKDTISAELQQRFENICQSFEKNGHVAIANEQLSIADKTVSADTVTYQFNYDDLAGFFQDALNEVVDFVDVHKEDFNFGNDSQALVDNLKKSLDSFMDSYKQSANKDLSVTIKFFLDTGNNTLLKAETSVSKIAEGSPDIYYAVEFPADSDTLMSLNVKVEGSKYKYNDGSLTAKLTKTSAGQVDTYALGVDYDRYEIDYTNYFDGDENAYNPYHETLTLTAVHDKDKSTLTLKNTNSSADKNSDYYTPPESLSDFFSSSSYALMGNFEITFNFSCTDDSLTIGDDSITVEYSANPTINEFKGERNFFSLTEDELNTIASIANGGNNISYLDTAADKQTKADMLDIACKKLYAGVSAGSINAETPSDELGNLDASKLPAPSATTAQRREIAQSLTIQDALNYDTLSDVFTYEAIAYEYGYSLKDGTIIAVNYSDEEDLSQYVFIVDFEQTTLGDLYNN